MKTEQLTPGRIIAPNNRELGNVAPYSDSMMSSGDIIESPGFLRALSNYALFFAIVFGGGSFSKEAYNILMSGNNIKYIDARSKDQKAIPDKRVQVYMAFPHTRIIDGLVVIEALNASVLDENAKKIILLSAKFDPTKPDIGLEHISKASNFFNKLTGIYNLEPIYVAQTKYVRMAKSDKRYDDVRKMLAYTRANINKLNSHLSDESQRVQVLILPEGTRQPNGGWGPFQGLEGFQDYDAQFIPLYIKGAKKLVNNDAKLIANFNPRAFVEVIRMPEIVLPNVARYNVNRHIQSKLLEYADIWETLGEPKKSHSG